MGIYYNHAILQKKDVWLWFRNKTRKTKKWKRQSKAYKRRDCRGMQMQTQKRTLRFYKQKHFIPFSSRVLSLGFHFTLSLCLCLRLCVFPNCSHGQVPEGRETQAGVPNQRERDPNHHPRRHSQLHHLRHFSSSGLSSFPLSASFNQSAFSSIPCMPSSSMCFRLLLMIDSIIGLSFLCRLWLRSLLRAGIDLLPFVRSFLFTGLVVDFQFRGFVYFSHL